MNVEEDHVENDGQGDETEGARGKVLDGVAQRLVHVPQDIPKLAYNKSFSCLVAIFNNGAVTINHIVHPYVRQRARAVKCLTV